MRSMFLGTALVALVAMPAVAQPPTPWPTTAVPQQVEPGRYWVFFDFNKSTLRADARRVVEDAAASYKRTGAAQIVLYGAADRSGHPAYNLRLSQRRADTVRRELERLGVPASVITVSAEGEDSPIVPTADGVREARNRYVAIVFPEREAPPPPAPVAAAPPPEAPPPPPPPKWYATIGPWAAYNLKETDNSHHQKSSVLLGPEVRVGYLFTPEWSVNLDGAGYNTLGTSHDDGYGGRVALGVSHHWNLGAAHPFIGPHVGYIAGKGTEDGVIIGPELGLDYDLAPKTFLYARVSYDHNFRNEINQGIINGGLGVGFRF